MVGSRKPPTALTTRDANERSGVMLAIAARGTPRRRLSCVMARASILVAIILGPFLGVAGIGSNALLPNANAQEANSASISDDEPDEEPWSERLPLALSQAASIPNDQWLEFARSSTASTESIKGQPLSIVLLMVAPAKLADATAEQEREYYWPMGTQPRPQEIVRAVSLSSRRGYVSVLQPEYISDVSFERKGEWLWGKVAFSADDLYAGQIDFVARVTESELESDIEIVEFAMPAFGLAVTRDSDGTWRQGELVTIDLAIRESFDRSVIALNRALTSPEPARSLDAIETELSRLRGLTERLDDELERTSSRGEERSEYWGLSDRLAWRSSLERLGATDARVEGSTGRARARDRSG